MTQGVSVPGVISFSYSNINNHTSREPPGKNGGEEPRASTMSITLTQSNDTRTAGAAAPSEN